MVFSGSYLRTSDNFGARIVKCLNVLEDNFLNKGGSLGNYAIVSIKKKLKHKVLSKKVFYAYISTVRQNIRYKNGHFIKFGENRVLIANESKKLLATRLKGPISINLKKKLNYRNFRVLKHAKIWL